MAKARRQFEAHFKLEVMRMIKERGRSVSEVCRSLDLGETAVRRWLTSETGREIRRNIRINLVPN
jgi:transposase